MIKYQVVFSKVAAKEICNLPGGQLKRVFEKSQELDGIS
jgi:mRNA-degrading endonuclease RelE of RelBE toxin-antitoxin system